MDTVQRLLPLLLPLVGLEGTVRCFHVCKSWRGELEAEGFCNKTAQLCWALAGGGDAERLQQNALRRLDATTDDDAERALCLDGSAFLEKSLRWKGSLVEWLQAASQEPDASFLSRGAASTAQSLGLALVQWVGKPQGKYPGSYTLPGHSNLAHTVALSRDGKRAASGSWDKLVKIWNAETGAEVSRRGGC
jgi:WD40 repeat protein